MAYSPYDNRQNRGTYQSGGQRYGGFNGSPQQIQPIESKELPSQYVDAAEQVIARIKSTQDQRRIITTTKIRKLFGLFIDLYNEIKRSDSEILTDNQTQVLTSARVRIVYECGRDTNVQSFVKDACLLEYLKSIGNSRKKLMNYYNYFESLVAYHRFYFGELKEKGQ